MRHARIKLGWTLLALMAVAVGLVVLAGCTMVGDSLTGVSLTKGPPTTCVKKCNDEAQLKAKDEVKRHQLAMDACNGDQACKDAETALHPANMQAINAWKQECQNNCHKQGTGSAG